MSDTETKTQEEAATEQPGMSDKLKARIDKGNKVLEDSPVTTRTVGVYDLKFVKRGDVESEVTICKRPSDAVHVFRAHFDGIDRESYAVILLDGMRNAIAVHTVAVGGNDGVTAEPQGVFRPALMGHADGVIIGHYTLNDAATPTVSGVEVHKRMTDAGKLLGIPMLDTLIISRSGDYRSMSQYIRNGGTGESDAEGCGDPDCPACRMRRIVMDVLKGDPTEAPDFPEDLRSMRDVIIKNVLSGRLSEEQVESILKSGKPSMEVMNDLLDGRGVIIEASNPEQARAELNKALRRMGEQIITENMGVGGSSIFGSVPKKGTRFND